MFKFTIIAALLMAGIQAAPVASKAGSTLATRGGGAPTPGVFPTVTEEGGIFCQVGEGMNWSCEGSFDSGIGAGWCVVQDNGDWGCGQ